MIDQSFRINIRNNSEQIFEVGNQVGIVNEFYHLRNEIQKYPYRDSFIINRL